MDEQHSGGDRGMVVATGSPSLAGHQLLPLARSRLAARLDSWSPTDLRRLSIVLLVLLGFGWWVLLSDDSSESRLTFRLVTGPKTVPLYP
jgi:hypothetical protein